MATDPPHTPVIAGQATSSLACSHGHSTVVFCTECARDAMRAELLREEPSRPRPTFNHTRADGPFDPCPECAALMSPTSLAKAYRTALADLLEMVEHFQRLTPVHPGEPHRVDSSNACCTAHRLLKATAGNRVGAGALTCPGCLAVVSSHAPGATLSICGACGWTRADNRLPALPAGGQVGRAR